VKTTFQKIADYKYVISGEMPDRWSSCSHYHKAYRYRI